MKRIKFSCSHLIHDQEMFVSLTAYLVQLTYALVFTSSIPVLDFTNSLLSLSPTCQWSVYLPPLYHLSNHHLSFFPSLGCPTLVLIKVFSFFHMSASLFHDDHVYSLGTCFTYLFSSLIFKKVSFPLIIVVSGNDVNLYLLGSDSSTQVRHE